MHKIMLLLLTIAHLALFSLSVKADPSYIEPETSNGRYLAVISDLHLSFGKVDQKWHPYEDFRWPNAFREFLKELSQRGSGRVDLVIAGDFLELWQIPDDISCKGNGSDLGCSVQEIIQITQRVISGHTETFSDLASFSQEGDNRVHIIPGNHDAALMIQEVWDILRQPLQMESGRIQWMKEGTWTSNDGHVVIEHGHQVPGDANRFDNWPIVTNPEKQLLLRPGGELGVQKLFNEVEREYPIIDNLSPETAGFWYRIQDQNVRGSIADLGRIVIFFLFETSLSQKAAFLGPEEIDDLVKMGEWDVKFAREDERLKWKLAAYAMPKNSKLRMELLADTSDPDIIKLREELDKLVTNKQLLSDDEILQLCDQAYTVSGELCIDTQTLGQSLNYIPGVRPYRFRHHLEARRKDHHNMTHFIYGHTHHLEEGHTIPISDTADLNSPNSESREIRVVVYNSGAFQRLMDSDRYQQRLVDTYPGVDTGEGLRTLTLENDFSPCYTVVLAPFKDGFYRPKTQRWYMEEDKESGRIVDVGYPLCN